MNALRSLAALAALGIGVGVGALGCAKAPADTTDAGADEAPPRDGKGPTCIFNTVCAADANAVRRCESDRTAGAIIEDCGATGACSLGRCTTPACMQAELAPNAAGCLFYGADVANVTSEVSEPTMILMTNGGASPAGVSVEMRDAGQSWTASQSITIDPGGGGYFTLPNRQFADAGKGGARSYRLVSDSPISAFVIQSDDGDQTSSSSAGTQLLPMHGLDDDYIAVTFAQHDTPKVHDTAGSRGGAGAITVVATQDGTTLTFVASPSATAVDGNGSSVAAPGGPYTVVLDDGDIYQLFSAGEGADLSGSTLSADKPIAVFSGNVSTTYGRFADGVNTPDLASEEMLSVSYWSTSYVAAWLPPQTCGSLLDGGGAGLWRIVGAVANTHLTFDFPPTLTGLPAEGTIGQGEVQEFVVHGGGDFMVRANQPIAVMQGMDCEPALSGAVPTDSLLDDLLFTLPPNFDHVLAIARPIHAPLILDGGSMNDQQFVPAGHGYEVVRVSIPACYGAPGTCTHHLQGKFGVSLRGMDGVCSYALTAATWKKCLDAGCVVP